MPSSKILGCGTLLILCLTSASTAQDELQDMQSPNEQEELMKDLRELLHSVQSILDQTNKTGTEKVNFGCRCSGLHCSCCRRIRIRRLRFDRNLRNPIPICVGAPFLRRAASVCIQLNDVRFGTGSVHACASLSVRLFYVTVARFGLGCYTIRLPFDEMEQAGALELAAPFHEDWIGTQQDPAVPDFEDDEATIGNNGRGPLLGGGDVVMMASMGRQASMGDDDAIMMANIEKPDLEGDLI